MTRAAWKRSGMSVGETVAAAAGEAAFNLSENLQMQFRIKCDF